MHWRWQWQCFARSSGGKKSEKESLKAGLNFFFGLLLCPDTGNFRQDPNGQTIQQRYS